VIDVGYEREAIKKAVKIWMDLKKAEPSDIYGGGDAGHKIASILSELSFRFHKTITY
jgi:hypothetical protein